jgi:hypothetical protein
MKRIHLNNPYIKLQKSPKQIENFNKFIALMEVMHADPADYILFAIKYYSPMRIFPTPSHLLSQRLVNKYRYHQSLKNIYVYDLYNIEKDSVYLYETGEEISYREDLISPIDNDPRLKYAVWLSKQKTNKYLNTDYRDVVYAIVKLTHLGKPIPGELKQLKERLYETYHM